jgi:hypothetical protein
MGIGEIAVILIYRACRSVESDVPHVEQTSWLPECCKINRPIHQATDINPQY